MRILQGEKDFIRITSCGYVQENWSFHQLSRALCMYILLANERFADQSEAVREDLLEKESRWGSGQART
jgi:hypothetical protein